MKLFWNEKNALLNSSLFSSLVVDAYTFYGEFFFRCFCLTVFKNNASQKTAIAFKFKFVILRKWRRPRFCHLIAFLQLGIDIKLRVRKKAYRFALKRKMNCIPSPDTKNYLSEWKFLWPESKNTDYNVLMQKHILEKSLVEKNWNASCLVSRSWRLNVTLWQWPMTIMIYHFSACSAKTISQPLTLCNLPMRLKGKNKSVPMFCLLWIKISNIRAEDYLLDWIARTVSYIMKRIWPVSNRKPSRAILSLENRIKWRQKHQKSRAKLRVAPR